MWSIFVEDFIVRHFEMFHAPSLDGLSVQHLALVPLRPLTWCVFYALGQYV